jgi:hypothetical protein
MPWGVSSPVLSGVAEISQEDLASVYQVDTTKPAHWVGPVIVRADDVVQANRQLIQILSKEEEPTTKRLAELRDRLLIRGASPLFSQELYRIPLRSSVSDRVLPLVERWMPKAQFVAWCKPGSECSAASKVRTALRSAAGDAVRIAFFWSDERDLRIDLIRWLNPSESSIPQLLREVPKVRERLVRADRDCAAPRPGLAAWSCTRSDAFLEGHGDFVCFTNLADGFHPALDPGQARRMFAEGESVRSTLHHIAQNEPVFFDRLESTLSFRRPATATIRAHLSARARWLTDVIGAGIRVSSYGELEELFAKLAQRRPQTSERTQLLVTSDLRGAVVRLNRSPYRFGSLVLGATHWPAIEPAVWSDSPYPEKGWPKRIRSLELGAKGNVVDVTIVAAPPSEIPADG